jgi:23S rRNA (guanosine2251-2'-O)-methyltransferase
MRETKSKPLLALGFHAIEAAIAAGKQIDKVMLTKGLQGELYQNTTKMLKLHQIPMQFVPIEKLNRISNKNHQGIIAFLSPITFGNLEEIISATFEKGESPLILLLDGVTDVRNLGAIARTAECMGAHAIVLPESGSAPVNEDAVKTSAGALMHLPICKTKTALDAVQLLQSMGVTCVAASEKAELTPQAIQFNQPICIIMGGEEKGISNNVIRTADHLIRIPMTGITTSLNVSVAAGMLLFETTRQRLIS